MSRPLEGRRILVTRSRSQMGEFSRLLRQAGAEVVEIPAIEIVPPAQSRAGCLHRAGPPFRLALLHQRQRRRDLFSPGLWSWTRP